MSLTKRFQDFINETNWQEDAEYTYDHEQDLRSTVEDALDSLSHDEYIRAAFRIAQNEIFELLTNKIIEAAERRNFTHRGDILDMIRGKMPGL